MSMDKSSAEISLEIDEKNKELTEALKNQEILDEEEMRLAKEILNLRMQKKDIELAQSKSRHNVRLLQIEIKNLTQRFWATKQQGL